MKIKVDAAAKINLSLDITGRLDNGFHTLFMVMQSVSIFDRVTLETTDTGDIEIDCGGADLPEDKNNIAVKAAHRFFSEAGIKNSGLKISIEKHIPVSAGLAGGSADAAAVIEGLNMLTGAELCRTALCSIGAQVGSDVPFCLCGGTKLAENTGDRLTPLPDLKDCAIVLCKPVEGVSTAQAYSDFDALVNPVHPDNEAIVKAMLESDLSALCKNAANVFEQVITLNKVELIRSALTDASACLSLMSGSGPTVLGIFTEKEKAEKARASLLASGLADFCEICKPVNYGVAVCS